jgi:arylsulfatase A-like enzyme
LVIFRGGLKFDTTAILYTNLLFLFLSVVPFKFRHLSVFQNILKYIFFFTNGIALFANFADIPYFNFVLERTTITVFDQFKHESNMGSLFLKFIVDYWTVAFFYFLSIFLMVYLYGRAKISRPVPGKAIWYYIVSTFAALATITLTIGGIRGDFKGSTRPITMSNAGQYVKSPAELAIVLNTPFCLIRSTEGTAYRRQNFFSSETELNKIYNPIHNPDPNWERHPVNVVIFIIESFNKEFIGSLYHQLDSGRYNGYTPFVDSLLQHSLTYKYSYANGRRSIEAIPSVITSIPSIEAPFVLSPYYNNNMTSLPLLLKKMGYKSALFHGAPNGSMGFQAFGQLAGVDEYYGKDEYNNDKDFDGVWGIWDEEFMQFMAHTLDTFSKPFVSTIFTVTSHHPFNLPERYKNKFVSHDFPLQRCIEYTDYSLKRFFETASKMKWYKNTLFIITADHVSLNQRPEFKNEIGYFSVPVIFYQPGSNLKGLDTTSIAQQIDIMPTVVNYIGYPEQYLAFGQDLFHADSTKFAVNFLNGIYRIYKGNYLLMFNGSTSVHLYNVKTDPLLTIDLVNTLPDIQSQLELLAKAFIQQYKNRMIDNKLTVSEKH